MKTIAEQAFSVKATVVKDFLNFEIAESMIPPLVKPAKAPKQ